MNDEELKMKWLDARECLCAEADAFRDSQAVSFGLLEAYDALTSDERIVIHSILAEWMLSDDNRLRYDAEFITSQRCIRSLKSAVEQALAKSESKSGPEAYYEAKKLRRILCELE